MRPGSLSWWVTKVRQTKRHLLARVPARERDAVAAWLSPSQLALFDAMHVADRRHGLDVVAALRAAGETDPEVLVAGLLHDAGKGDAGMVPRIVHALGQAGMGWVATRRRRLAGHAPRRSSGCATTPSCRPGSPRRRAARRGPSSSSAGRTIRATRTRASGSASRTRRTDVTDRSTTARPSPTPRSRSASTARRP